MGIKLHFLLGKQSPLFTVHSGQLRICPQLSSPCPPTHLSPALGQRGLHFPESPATWSQTAWPMRVTGGRLKGLARNQVPSELSPTEAVLLWTSSSLCTAPASVVPALARSSHKCRNSWQRGLTHRFLQLNFLKSRSSLLLLLSSGLPVGPHLSHCNQVHFLVSDTLRAKDLQGFLFWLLFYSASI